MGEFSLTHWLIMLLVSVGPFILVAVFGRELFCWYFKTNRTIALLEEIQKSLQAQNGGGSAPRKD